MAPAGLVGRPSRPMSGRSVRLLSSSSAPLPLPPSCSRGGRSDGTLAAAPEGPVEDASCIAGSRWGKTAPASAQGAPRLRHQNLLPTPGRDFLTRFCAKPEFRLVKIAAQDFRERSGARLTWTGGGCEQSGRCRSAASGRGCAWRSAWGVPPAMGLALKLPILT